MIGWNYGRAHALTRAFAVHALPLRIAVVAASTSCKPHVSKAVFSEVGIHICHGDAACALQNEPRHPPVTCSFFPKTQTGGWLRGSGAVTCTPPARPKPRRSSGGGGCRAKASGATATRVASTLLRAHAPWDRMQGARCRRKEGQQQDGEKQKWHQRHNLTE